MTMTINDDDDKSQSTVIVPSTMTINDDDDKSQSTVIVISQKP